MTLTLRASAGHQSATKPSRMVARFDGWTGDDIANFTVVIGRKSTAPATFADMDPHLYWHLNDVDILSYSQTAATFKGTFTLINASLPEFSAGDHLWLCLFAKAPPDPPADADTPLAHLGPFTAVA